MRKVRSNDRRRRRFRVTVGAAVSFTVDVSAGGFCTESMRVLVAGTLVNGTIEASGKKASFTGRVVWNAPGDAALNVRGRMGIAFATIGPEIADLLSNHADTRRVA